MFYIKVVHMIINFIYKALYLTKLKIAKQKEEKGSS